MTQHTIAPATEWGIGQGVNGTGKRAKVSGFYVVNHAGRRVRAFTGKNAETDARNWAAHLTECTDDLGRWR